MKFRHHPALVGKQDFFKADPRQLKVDPAYNVRNLDAPEHQADLEELMYSIIDVGVQTPLKCRIEDDELIVVEGHRRLRAVMMAIGKGHEIAAVPVLPEDKRVDEQERAVGLIISNSGKPLLPLEQAEVVRRLLGYGWSRDKLAGRVGKSTQWVNTMEQLLSAPADVKAMVNDGEVSATVAATTVRKDGQNAGETLTKAKARATAEGRETIKPRDVKAAREELNLNPTQVTGLVTLIRQIAEAGDGEKDRELARSGLERIGVKIETAAAAA